MLDRAQLAFPPPPWRNLRVEKNGGRRDRLGMSDKFMRAAVEGANRQTSLLVQGRQGQETPTAAAVAGSILVAETCALAEGHAETRRRGPRAGDAFATMPY